MRQHLGETVRGLFRSECINSFEFAYGKPTT